MSVLLSIFNAVGALPVFAEKGIHWSISETPLETPGASVMGMPGGGLHDLYIGSGKQVDFLFRIVYKMNNESPQERAFAYEFFDIITAFLANNKILLENGKDEIRCVLSSAANKLAANPDNSQEWAADYTITYQEC